MKMKKRIMALVVALVMLLTAIPVQAAKQVEVNVFKEERFSKQPYANTQETIGSVTGTRKISISYSNKSILTVVKKRSKWDKNTTDLVVKLKKPGKTIVTVKVEGKKYKCNVTVDKYTHGLRYLKIGNIRVPKSKLDKTNRIYVKYSKVANRKVKINVGLKKDWHVASIDNKTKTEGPLSFNTPIKFTGGPGGYFQFYAYNGKTGKSAVFRVYLTK